MYAIHQPSCVCFTLATALIVGLGMTPAAQAVSRAETQNAAGVCQGALPVYSTTLRNRPTAIANESRGRAFVSCSMLSDVENSESPTRVAAIFSNNTGTDANVDCTFVDGSAAGILSFFPKSLVISAGAIRSISWNPDDDNGGLFFTNISNLSCALPPGVEINRVVRLVEDGSAPAP